MNNISKLALLFISIFIISCSDDDTSGPVIPDGDFFDGTLILNEGGSAGGSVSFLNSDLDSITNNIFETNNGVETGLFLQSIFFEDDRAYIISNGSNLISVVNRFTFELVGTVESDLSVPRYGTVHNGKAYVTNQGDFTTTEDDFVAVIDLESLEVEETVVIGNVVEHIVETGDQLYIQNAAFGVGDKITKFDPVTNTVVSTLEVGAELNSLQEKEDLIYTLDTEGLKVIDPVAFTISRSVAIPQNLNSISNLRIEDDQLYYTSGTAAYSSQISATTLSSEPIFDYGSNSQFGTFYGFDVNEGNIFVGDAGDFRSNGSILIYSTSGDLIQELTVGDIGPNSFYFQ